MNLGNCTIVLALFASAASDAPIIYRADKLVVPIYIEFVGTLRQIHNVKRYSKSHALIINCEGIANDFRTLRVLIPKGTSRKIVEGHFGGHRRVDVYKQQIVYPGMHLAENCAVGPIISRIKREAGE